VPLSTGARSTRRSVANTRPLNKLPSTTNGGQNSIHLHPLKPRDITMRTLVPTLLAGSRPSSANSSDSPLKVVCRYVSNDIPSHLACRSSVVARNHSELLCPRKSNGADHLDRSCLNSSSNASQPDRSLSFHAGLETLSQNARVRRASAQLHSIQITTFS
jgi:hypothetical protein